MSGRVAYIDCVGGAAGDMLLGALLDAGADEGAVRAGLRGIGIDGLDFEVSTTRRHGVGARRVETLPERDSPKRSWADIDALIAASDLPERPREVARRAFRRLAGAESRVHGTSIGDVHFHEVGGTDAIIDVCAVALAVHDLDIATVTCSPLPLAPGSVEVDHGTLPLPAPATLELLRGCPVRGVDWEAELVTPTGAALVTALADDFGAIPGMTLESIGYGAGSRDLAAIANVVRVIVGQPAALLGDREIAQLETNLDDMLPELVPDAAADCFSAGALDVWTAPALMKQGRPGFVMHALAPLERADQVADAMLRSTTALGVRLRRVERRVLDRESVTVDAGGSPVRVKVGRLGGVAVNLAPEHADCVAVARRTDRPVKAVWAEALAQGERLVGATDDRAGPANGGESGGR